MKRAEEYLRPSIGIGREILDSASLRRDDKEVLLRV
jgi:hypothetical protein